MKKLRKDAKAISPLVATLLLIAIAVAASVITYSWVMSMISAQSQQAQTQIRIDVVEFKKSNGTGQLDTIVLTIRNTGSVAASIESVAVRTEGTTVTATLASPITISVGETNTYTFTRGTDGVALDWRWELSKSYTIRVTCTTGFYYEAFVASPSTAPA